MLLTNKEFPLYKTYLQMWEEIILQEILNSSLVPLYYYFQINNSLVQNIFTRVHKAVAFNKSP